MTDQPKSVLEFVETLYVASLVEGKPFDDIVEIANANGYKFSPDEAALAFRKIFNDNGRLPEWLKKKLSEVNLTAGYRD